MAASDTVAEKFVPAFLAGGGEIGAHMRSHVWSTSPFGTPDEWPPALRTMVGLMLNSKVPMFVAWGPEICLLYNDACSEIFGGTQALGSPFEDTWRRIAPDSWPAVEKALDGEPILAESQSLLVNRAGDDEEILFTLSLSPLHSDSGEIAGLFGTLAETGSSRAQGGLHKHRSNQAFLLDFSDCLREIAAPRDVMAAAAGLLGQHLGAIRVGYSEVESDGVYINIVDDWCADGVTSVAGRHHLESYSPDFVASYRAGQAVVVDDFDTDPRTAGKPAAAAHRVLGIGAQLAVPLVKAEGLIALLFVHDAAPRRWSDEEVALVRAVAERTWAAVERARAEQALRMSEVRFRTALEIGTVGAIYFDMDGTLTDANDAFLAMGGYSRADLESGDMSWQKLTPAE